MLFQAIQQFVFKLYKIRHQKYKHKYKMCHPEAVWFIEQYKTDTSLSTLSQCLSLSLASVLRTLLLLEAEMELSLKTQQAFHCERGKISPLVLPDTMWHLWVV